MNHLDIAKSTYTRFQHLEKALQAFERLSPAFSLTQKQALRKLACDIANAVLPIYLLSYNGIAAAGAIRASRNYANGLSYSSALMSYWGDPIQLEVYRDFELTPLQNAAMHAHMSAMATTRTSAVEAVLGASLTAGIALEIVAKEHGEESEMVARALIRLKTIEQSTGEIITKAVNARKSNTVCLVESVSE